MNGLWPTMSLSPPAAAEIPPALPAVKADTQADA